MPAAKLNLQVEQNATYRKKFTLRSQKGRPVNLTGFAALMQIRASYGVSEVLLELSTDNGRIKPLSNDGAIELEIPSAQTATLGQGVYDIVLVSPDNSVKRLVQGKVLISPGTSKAIG